jgi:HK97 family phage major capsid protein
VIKNPGFLLPSRGHRDKTRPFGTLEKMEAADVSSDGLIDLPSESQIPQNAVWVMNPTPPPNCKKLKNGNGDYIWRDRLLPVPRYLPVRSVSETMPDAEW